MPLVVYTVDLGENDTFILKHNLIKLLSIHFLNLKNWNVDKNVKNFKFSSFIGINMITVNKIHLVVFIFWPICWSNFGWRGWHIYLYDHPVNVSALTNKGLYLGLPAREIKSAKLYVSNIWRDVPEAYWKSEMTFFSRSLNPLLNQQLYHSN